MYAKIHIREYNTKQMILFPRRLDKDIVENDPVLNEVLAIIVKLY